MFRITGAEIGGALLDAEADIIAGVRQLGGGLTLGIRPQAIALSHQPSSGSIEATIELVEPMGSVNHVILRIIGAEEVTEDGEPFIAVVRSNEDLTPDSRTWITLRSDRLVLFEQKSGRAVGVPSGERKWRCA